MNLKKVFEIALLGTVIGLVLGIVAAMSVTGNNYRVMFIMTFTEVGLIAGLLTGAKIEDKKETTN